jgi:hypothetical protein
VNVKQRHDVEAAVTLCQLQRVADVVELDLAFEDGAGVGGHASAFDHIGDCTLVGFRPPPVDNELVQLLIRRPLRLGLGQRGAGAVDCH